MASPRLIPVAKSLTSKAWQEVATKLHLSTALNHGVFANSHWSPGSTGAFQESYDPSTGERLGRTTKASVDDFRRAVEGLKEARPVWQALPMPKRGEVIRQMREAMSQLINPLGTLVSLETGKPLAEGIGEIQEYLDICDYAVGLSRQIGGSIFPSERPDHFFMERWNPLGIVGVISAFNFPAAVYGWNSAIALMCGNVVLWKPAGTTVLTAVAISKILESVLRANNLPTGICSLVAGGADVGEAMARCPDISLLSFTGSTPVGRRVGVQVQERFGKSILELGGNNAVVVMDDADLDMAVRGTLFAAIGTAGQRCTTARRLLVHRAVFGEFMRKLIAAYEQVPIGHALDANVLCGPVHRQESVAEFKRVVEQVREQGGEVLYGGRVLADAALSGGFYVQPTITRMPRGAAVLQSEAFVPIIHAVEIDSLSDAIAMNNSVSQGLSSALFTRSQRAIFEWTGPSGSDCGISNINIPTNGAEIGGAFGGEKETGGGRESGSNAWQQYMRRSTCTINYGSELPLAQGIKFL